MLTKCKLGMQLHHWLVSVCHLPASSLLTLKPIYHICNGKTRSDMCPTNSYCTIELRLAKLGKLINHGLEVYNTL